MKIKNIIQLTVLFGLVVSIFLLSTINVFSEDEQGFHNKEHHKEWQAKKAKMYEELGITEEQKKAFKLHKDSHHKETKALREKIKAKRKAFRQALEDPNADNNTIKAANNELKALSNSLDDSRLNGVLEIRKILTPEQFQKFNEMEKNHKKKRNGDYKGSQKH